MYISTDCHGFHMQLTVARIFRTRLDILRHNY